MAAYCTEKDSVTVAYRCDGIKEKIVYRFVSFIEPKIIDNKVFIDDMEIKSDLIVCPKISKKDYAKYLGKAGVAYTIDYEVDKASEIDSSFSFRFQ